MLFVFMLLGHNEEDAVFQCFSCIFKIMYVTCLTFSQTIWRRETAL
jgi:hypothetical protein